MLDPWFKKAYPLTHLKKWIYWPWAEYRVLRDARAVLFTSEQERRLARRSFWLYRCNEYVANYGTAGPPGSPSGQRTRFLGAFPQLEGKRCLLFLGRVHEKKGPDLLLKALASVFERLPRELTDDVHLIMAGPNEHEFGRQMVRLVRELSLTGRVTWTGMLQGDLKWGAFYAADAFILPSHQENFGVSVAEALACSLPVLISDQVNIWREISADGAALVEPDNLQGAINLIERWIETPAAEWADMRTRARKCYESRFAVEKAATSLITAIEMFGGSEP